ncbi:MAG: hypothetical protein HC911_08030 [Chloroflexaceae bacterium]|nr:hypothetical protein [Chloroflexaceae bacterium]
MSDSSLDELIDELEDVLADGRRLPFGMVLVNEDKILDIVDKMRVAVPDEIKQARRVVQEQERMLDEAQARVQQVLTEQGLLDAVQAERERMLVQAEQEAITIRNGADVYAREVLEDLDDQLVKLLTSVRNGLESLNHVGQ